MHLRAFVLGAFLSTAVAAAQEVSASACEAVCTQSKATPVAVVAGQDCQAKAAPVAVIAAQDCQAKASPVALFASQDRKAKADPAALVTCPNCQAKIDPAGLIVRQDRGVEAAPVALSSLGFDAAALSLDDEELQDLVLDLENLQLDLDLSELMRDLELDIDFEGGRTIAIKLGEDGNYQVLQGAGDLTDLTTGLQDLALAPDLALESDAIVAELSELSFLSDSSDERGYLGVQMNFEGGMNVMNVLPGSGAAKAGLQAGDRILSINGKSTGDEGISEYLQSLQAGETAKITFARGDRKQTAKVRLMTLGAIEGGEEEEEAEEIEEIIEADESFGGSLVRVEAGGGSDDFRVLRTKVRDSVLGQLEAGEQDFTVRMHGHDGQVKVIDTKELPFGEQHEGHITFGVAVGGDDEDEVHIFSTDGGNWVSGKPLVLRAHADEGEGHVIHFGSGAGHAGEIEVHVDARAGAPSRGIFMEDPKGKGDVERHGKVVIKRVENGNESVEEYEWTGDDFGDLPQHVIDVIHQHGAGGGIQIHPPHGQGQRVEKRIEVDSSHGGQNVFRVRRGQGQGTDAPDVEHVRIARPDARRDVLFLEADNAGRWVQRLHLDDDDDDDHHDGHDDDHHHDGHDDDDHHDGDHQVWSFRTDGGGEGQIVLKLHGPDGQRIHENVERILHERLGNLPFSGRYLQLHGEHDGDDDEHVVMRLHAVDGEQIRDRDGNFIFDTRQAPRGLMLHADHDEDADGDDDEHFVMRLHAVDGQQIRDRDGNRIFGARQAPRGLMLHADHDEDDDDDDDDEGAELVHRLHLELRELHERIDELEAMIERLGRRR